jgi:hypothetical protein
MEQYVGLDVSLKLTAICIVDRTGKIGREGWSHLDADVGVWLRNDDGARFQRLAARSIAPLITLNPAVVNHGTGEVLWCGWSGRRKPGAEGRLRQRPKADVDQPQRSAGSLRRPQTPEHRNQLPNREWPEDCRDPTPA